MEKNPRIHLYNYCQVDGGECQHGDHKEVIFVSDHRIDDY